MIRRVSVASGNLRMVSDAARAPYPTYGSGCRHDKTRQRRIRHLRTVSDAARAPYPTYSSIAWRI
ncbi:hypothetical protein LQT93_26215 (plasmid) [Escherichia coli]|nr:hypothetical protein LQT93_26215 [Escherichia coli]